MTNFLSRRADLITWLVVLVVSFTSVLQASPADAMAINPVRKVALAGTQIPGGQPGEQFSSFFDASINNRGQVAFTSLLTGRTATVWNEGIGSLSLVARTGQPATGAGPGITFDVFNSLGHNDLGQFAFSAGLRGEPFTQSGFWSGRDGNNLRPVAIEREDNVPGAPGTFYRQIAASSLNNLGEAAFFAMLGGPDVDEENLHGFWSEAGGNGLQLISRTGDLAPGTEPGVRFRFGSSSVSIGSLGLNNDLGQVAFLAGLSGPPINGLNDSGIWSDAGGNGLELVVREGDSAPGIRAATFRSLRVPLFNNQGEIAFLGRTSGGGLNRGSVWSNADGGLHLVAREDGLAPGVVPSNTFASFETLALNDDGQVAFFARLNGPAIEASTSEGIWSEGGGNGLQLVVQEGQHAPGMAPQILIERLQDSFALNNEGMIAFLATLVGPGIDASNGQSLWAQGADGEPKLVARAGDVIDVSDPGSLAPDLRTVSDVRFFSTLGGGNGGMSGFNDRGQVAFRAFFTDGSSGVFVSNLLVVPEPSAAILLILAGVLQLSRRD